MSLYAATVPSFTTMLGNLDTWLDHAVTYADSREFDPAVLLTTRLYPDQFDFTRQVQSACDTAKLTCARLAEVEAPPHEDGPCSMEDLKARIAEVKSFINELDADTIDASAELILSPTFLQGMSITAPDYVNGFALPNFYFHVSMAYAILRSSGVKLGKRTYIGSLNLIPPA